jgi:tripartite-type tricarboxylate transporter receptor subunit TctC
MRPSFVVAAIVLTFLTGGAWPQAYPTKAIRIVVTTPPGSGPDVRARQVGAGFPALLGQPLVVESKVGADGAIAAEFVSKAPADGYILLLGTSQTHAINPWLIAKLPYRPDEDFVPVTSLSMGYWLLAVHPEVSASSVNDLMQLARSKPGQLRYASNGEGSFAHLFMESVKAARGVDMIHIPYKGAAAEVPDFLAGRVQVAIDSPVVFGPLHKAGKIRVLAITGPRRIAMLPDVPSLAEAGLPNVEINVWLGFFAPAGTPRPFIARLQPAIAKILNEPQLRSQIVDSGNTLGGEPPEQFAAFVRRDREGWGKVVREAKIAPR